ncbi:MAG: HNH endonuclease [Desertimonas sp.]
MTDTAASLGASAADLSSLATALQDRAEWFSSHTSAARTDVDALCGTWGGPRAVEVLTTAHAYLDTQATVAEALSSASQTVSSWSTAATSASDDMARAEGALAAQYLIPDPEAWAAAVAEQRSRKTTIREQWTSTCLAKSDELSAAITTLISASTSTVTTDERRALTDGSYFGLVSQLTVEAELDIGAVDPTGTAGEAIAARAALLGSEDGALLFLILDTAKQGNIDDADGNFSMDDMIAGCDPARVRELLEQSAAAGGVEWTDAELDLMTDEIVSTAWMMRASENEAWEDLDDDIEWYERGPVAWARENLLAPVLSVTVGALCYSTAIGTATATGGVSLGAAGYCGGLAAATYQAANSWAHGGSAGQVVDSFTDPQTWLIGAGEGVLFQGATSILLRQPGAPLSAAARTPNGAQYSVAYEMQLDPADLGRARGVHERRALAVLDDAMSSDTRFAQSMEELIDGIGDAARPAGGRSTPSGWTWHHVPSSAAQGRVGVMQLVPRSQHAPGSIFQDALHPNGAGGYAEWAIPAGATPN